MNRLNDILESPVLKSQTVESAIKAEEHSLIDGQG